MTETANANETFVPHEWDTAKNSGAPAPYIPVYQGLTQRQYETRLESFGVHEQDGSRTAGRGYGDRVVVISDPFTGAVGYVTQWEWNSRVEWGVWTPDGRFEQRGKSDVHCWPWDAVKTVRHLMAFTAFKAAHDAGELVSYWAGMESQESAEAAHGEWLTQRTQAFAR